MPDLVTWNDSYSVKVNLCDTQHKKLFAIMNELADAMRVGKGQEIFSRMIGELMQYTRTHFQQEEALMRRANFPQLAAHQEMHRRFVADLEMLDRNTREGRTGNSVPLLNMLRDWLVNHIQKMDKAYTAHLNAAGIH
jgi:hemerythrin